MDLVLHVLGEFYRILVVSGTTVCIRLLLPSGSLCHIILAFLGQLAKLSGS